MISFIKYAILLELGVLGLMALFALSEIISILMV